MSVFFKPIDSSKMSSSPFFILLRVFRSNLPSSRAYQYLNLMNVLIQIKVTYFDQKLLISCNLFRVNELTVLLSFSVIYIICPITYLPMQTNWWKYGILDDQPYFEEQTLFSFQIQLKQLLWNLLFIYNQCCK